MEALVGFELILKPIFFAVYNINDEKLESSAWYFWQYQFSDLVAPSGQVWMYYTHLIKDGLVGHYMNVV
jgi:hypothetical protein